MKFKFLSQNKYLRTYMARFRKGLMDKSFVAFHLQEKCQLIYRKTTLYKLEKMSGRWREETQIYLIFLG